MIKRTQAQWREIFVRYANSGLSAATFCKQNRLCPKYFSLRRKQLDDIKPKIKRKPRFSKVKVFEPTASKNETRLLLPNGVTVVVPDLSKDQLNELRSAMQLVPYHVLFAIKLSYLIRWYLNNTAITPDNKRCIVKYG